MSLRRPALFLVPPLLLALALAVVLALSGPGTPPGGEGGRGGTTARESVAVPVAADEQLPRVRVEYAILKAKSHPRPRKLAGTSRRSQGPSARATEW